MPKTTVLTFAHNYLPGYRAGGTTRTIANLVNTLGEELDFWIVTSDRDFKSNTRYPDVEVGAWRQLGNARVFYSSPSKQGVLDWRHLIADTPHDVLYLNSLFDPVFTLRPLFARKWPGTPKKPLVIAPRGELSPGALALKRWKKISFLLLARITGFYRDALWHASTGDEAQLIRRHFGRKARVLIARDIPQATGLSHPGIVPQQGSRPLKVVFLSRISRKKNLDFALKVLARARIPIQFDIWGIVEDTTYWQQCQKLIDKLPTNVATNYRGESHPEDVVDILARYDLFFLPTHGENYGHVIAEAMSAGTPVLISDTTPWRNLSASQVGWDLPLDLGEMEFAIAIERAADQILPDRTKWQERVLDFARHKLEDADLIAANMAVFRSALKS